jgi:twitching motility protein PilT
VKLVDSLLDAISRLEGDALIMHVGEKPYVVTTSASMYAYRGPLAWGHVELSSRVLTTEAVMGMLEQLLPADQRKGLDEYGAVEYALPRGAQSSDLFTVVAARGGDDVWLELRRRPSVLTAAPEAAASSAPASSEAVEPAAADPRRVQPQPMYGAADALAGGDDRDDETAFEDGNDPVPFEVVEEEPQIVPTHAEVDALLTATVSALMAAAPARAVDPETPGAVDEPLAHVDELPAVTTVVQPRTLNPMRPEERLPIEEPRTASEFVAVAGVRRAPEAAPPSRPLVPDAPRQTILAEEPRQAVVLPLSRSPIAAEPPVEVRAAGAPIDRMLRIAAARGAATVYVVAQAQPVIRVDGEISVLDGEPALTAAEVERLVMDLAPTRGRETLPAGEWMADVPDVGRVRCVTFRDHRGPGVIFRMIPPKAISADQLGLAPEVQALCAQADGLVLVTGARASGKSTLLSAFVDVINRTRSDHVITIESQIGFVHESRRSFVSQREVRGDSDAATGAVRSAFREDPDVLVIEDMRTPEIVSAAFEAAESGRLVFGSVAAPSTTAALDRLIEMFPSDRRAQAQTSLAGSLRGVVAQTLLRKVRGGRVAAREVLLSTPAVASLILEGKTFQLPVALDSGRRHGMMPLTDSLAALVREGTVHAAEAYRRASDPEALLAALRRDGVDTSFAERLA